MTVEIISRSISTKVWDRTGIELATPGSAVNHASVARHVTNCATLPGRVKAVSWAVSQRNKLKKLSEDDKKACKITQHARVKVVD